MGTILFSFVNEGNLWWHFGTTRIGNLFVKTYFFKKKPVKLFIIWALTNRGSQRMSKTNLFHFHVSFRSRPTFMFHTLFFFRVLLNSRHLHTFVGHLPKCGRSDITSALTENRHTLRAARLSFIAENLLWLLSGHSHKPYILCLPLFETRLPECAHSSVSAQSEIPLVYELATFRKSEEEPWPELFFTSSSLSIWLSTTYTYLKVQLLNIFWNQKDL